MKEKGKRADLEGSAEDAEFDKGHMGGYAVVQRRGIGGSQLERIEHYYVHSTRGRNNRRRHRDVLIRSIITPSSSPFPLPPLSPSFFIHKT